MIDTKTPAVVFINFVFTTILVITFSLLLAHLIREESSATRKLIIEMGNFKTLNNPMGDVAELQMDERYRITNIVFVAGREPKKD